METAFLKFLRKEKRLSTVEYAAAGNLVTERTMTDFGLLGGEVSRGINALATALQAVLPGGSLRDCSLSNVGIIELAQLVDRSTADSVSHRNRMETNKSPQGGAAVLQVAQSSANTTNRQRIYIEAIASCSTSASDSPSEDCSEAEGTC